MLKYTIESNHTLCIYGLYTFSLFIGEEGSSFNEAQLISANSKVIWSNAFSDVCKALVGMCDSTQANIHPEVPYDAALERRVKIFPPTLPHVEKDYGQKQQLFV